MNRRNVLKSLAIGAMISAIPLKVKANYENSIKKAKKLNRGDKVAIIAPATAVSDPLDMQKAKEFLSHFDLVPVFGSSFSELNGYKSKSEQLRAKDINDAFANPEIKAIFPIRGGYGSAAILDFIDFDLIRNNPKIFCGYSDITALHLAIFKHSGIVTFHSPMLLSAFNEFSEKYFIKSIFESNQELEIINPQESKGFRQSYPLTIINEGKAEGRLIGGNLSLICSLIGTKYLPSFDNSILFLEDVGEAPYRIDRMINQLLQTGILKNVKAIVIGKCDDCMAKDTQNSMWDRSELEVYTHYLQRLKIPVVYGYMIGHTANQITLPIGINTVLDTKNQSFVLTESATTV